MTVAELIAKLETMPSDAVVVYQACSDYSILEEFEIGLQTAEETKTADDEWIARSQTDPNRAGSEYWKRTPEQTFFRAGRYVRCRRTDYPPDETPVYATCVTLPGN